MTLPWLLIFVFLQGTGVVDYFPTEETCLEAAHDTKLWTYEQALNNATMLMTVTEPIAAYCVHGSVRADQSFNRPHDPEPPR